MNINLTYLKNHYYAELTNNILPFWITHARDVDAGGYHTCLNRDGSVYDYDKLCMWHAGRIIWTYSHMYNELEQKPEYLDMATWGIQFVEEYGFMDNGYMYYGLTRDGKPMIGKQDVYTELSTVLGYTEYARALRNDKWYNKAKNIFYRVWDHLQEPGQAYLEFLPEGKKVRLHGHSMITMNVLQELRRFEDDQDFQKKIDTCISNIIDKHLKKEKKAIFELVGWEGNKLPGHIGRWINPGHMIEGGIFFIHEGKKRNDELLRKFGIDFIDWGFQWGWDKDFGGIYNDVDLEALPFPSGGATTADAKLWWQHSEALYGLLLAYAETGEEKYYRAYKATHDYSFKNFADPVYGEWYATLDRRGNKIGYAKGTARKNSFHISRNFFCCYRLLEGI